MHLYVFIIFTYTELFFLVKSLLKNRETKKQQTESYFAVYGKVSIANCAMTAFLMLLSISIFFIPADILEYIEDGVMTIFLAGCLFNAFMTYSSSRRVVVNGDTFTNYTIFKSTTYKFEDTYINIAATAGDEETVIYYVIINREEKRLFTMRANWHNMNLFYVRFFE